MRATAVALFLALCVAAPADTAAQTTESRPEPIAKADRIPAARDIRFDGAMSLEVDVTDVARRIFRVRQQIPVSQSGDLVLLYPKWLPGKHRASGEIEKVAGLKFSAGGKPLEWRRDTLDVYAFRVSVPDGVKTIDVEFQFVSPTAANQGRIVATPDMASIQFVSLSLYPAGYFVRNIPVQASLKLPEGWRAATALRPIGGSEGATIRYETVSYETLIDSPAIAGRHFRRIALKEDVALDVVADTAGELAAEPEQIAAHKRLVDQALKLFGARHYDHYDFLLTISKNLGGIGLEHHRSSENGVDPGYFTEWDKALGDRDLLAHEFVHSWNGKYRRGTDLWTADYRTPMENSLLWVYEGQTQLWGYVLSARSGMLSKDDVLGALAAIAATYDNTPGRNWRPLIDTTNDPIIAARAPQAWRSWQRSEDYYNEGLLIWADIDRIIREESRGRRSLDDFARAFFGMNDGDWGQLTYDFEDVVATLNRVQPYDWQAYLKRKVDVVADKAPLEGLTKGGYRLVYTDTPTDWTKALERSRKNSDLSHSGGFIVGNDGKITAVIWDSPAFQAGLTVGSELLAVNGRSFDGDLLKEAIRAAKDDRRPIALLVKSGDTFRTLELDWHGGLRYPRLEKSGKGQGTLDALLAAR